MQGRFAAQALRQHARCRQFQLQRRRIKKSSTFALDECRVQVSLAKRFARHHAAQEGHVGVRAHDVRFPQRSAHACQGFGAVTAPHDELGNHRVVMRRDGIAFQHTAINSGQIVAALKGHMLGPSRHRQLPGGRHEVSVGVLGADARFNGVACHGQLMLLQGQRFTGGHAQLPFDEVQTRDGFGDRVLYLQARVHLHKVER